jgi:hypothetical protein
VIRVVRQPVGTVNGVALRNYKLGRTYEPEPSLADYLVLNGYAIIEMRKSARSRRMRPNERRRA